MANHKYAKALLMYKKPASAEDSSSNSAEKDSDRPNQDGALSKVGVVNAEGGDEVLENPDEDFKVFEWDCLISESHEVGNDVTQYPIQSGFIVSDHVIRRNRVITLKGVIVNVKQVPYGLSSEAGGLAPAIGAIGGAMLGTGLGVVLGSLTYTLLRDANGPNAVQDNFNELNRLCREGLFVHVSTILGPYVNCVVRSVKVSQDSTTSSIGIFEVVLEEIQVVDETEAEAQAIANIRRRVQETAKATFDWNKLVLTQGLNFAVAMTRGVL